MGTARIVFDRWSDRYADRIAGVRSSAVRDLFAAASRPDVISLSGGMPAVGLVPAEAVATAARDAVLHEGAAALQYGGSDGRLADPRARRRAHGRDRRAPQAERPPRHRRRAAGPRPAREDVPQPRRLIITEGPTYVGALQAFSAYQPDIRCIPMDDDGMRMDLLEAELGALGPRGAKFIYTIPNFQNPAGVTMSPERRRRLLELAREYDIPVVEDDPYGRLRFEGGHIQPLRSLDDEVIYLGTFSKIFAPGSAARAGWPRPRRSSPRCCSSSRRPTCAAPTSRRSPPSATSRARAGAVRWPTSRARTPSAATRCSPRSRSTSRPRHAGPSRTAASSCGSSCPPYVDCATMLAEAVEHGVTFAPGDGFYPDGRGTNCMRLAFCYAEPEAITEGIRRLAEVLEDRLELYRAFIAAGALPDLKEGAA